MPRNRIRFSQRPGCLWAHETQIPKPGDYFVSSMGEESVILCRDREGEIHVFLTPAPTGA